MPISERTSTNRPRYYIKSKYILDGTEYNFSEKQLVLYEVLKDSILRYHNIHLLTITGITNADTFNLKNSEVIISIIIYYDKIIIHEGEYRIIKSNIVSEVSEMKTSQLWLISTKTYEFLHSSRYGSLTSVDTNSYSSYLTSYQMLSKILQGMASFEGNEFDFFLSDSGEVKNIHKNIRLPETLNDIDIFKFILKYYPPYLLTPYILFDDFFFDNTKTTRKYNFHFINMCDTNGSYTIRNKSDIKGFGTYGYKYMGSRELIDYKKVARELKATLILKNVNENKLYELKPLDDLVKSKEIIQLETTLSINDFKSRLYLRKKLVQAEATIETFQLGGIALGDVTFNNVYNMDSDLIFDYLPLSIHYSFELSNSNLFELNTEVEFAKVPGNILAT